jgi:diaminohydroxyphosphoribosylaminopyrimidine deaminase/5-amino-6-(5-phosphoribosylamino)uracil reductase
MIGAGATQPGGRPHAEAVALEAAGEAASGATVYTTLEPCAHRRGRGPSCADLLVAARPARIVAALEDPDPRTAGRGIARLREAGIAVDVGIGAEPAARSLEGFLTRLALGRPFVTLKLALSIDGKIALPSGESKWITGVAARTHVHQLRAQADMILVGRGTYEADQPSLDVRLPGLEHRSPLPGCGPGRPSAHLSRAHPDRRGQVVGRLYRPVRPGGGARAMAAGGRPRPWHGPPRSLRARARLNIVNPLILRRD